MNIEEQILEQVNYLKNRYFDWAMSDNPEKSKFDDTTHVQAIKSLITKEIKQARININRVWAMPNKWTFTIKPIRELLEQEVGEGLWCDPFAGKNSPAQVTNDINPEIEATHHLDALEFLANEPDGKYDGILLDPPYSHRQVSEHYKAVGVKVTGWHTSAGWQKTIKDHAERVLKPNGKVICFGWNSMGLGKNRGFKMTRVLLVPHGGAKNDTIVTVELKLNKD